MLPEIKIFDNGCQLTGNLRVLPFVGKAEELKVEIIRQRSACLFRPEVIPRITEVFFKDSLINFETLSGVRVDVQQDNSSGFLIKRGVGLRQLSHLKRLSFSGCQIFDDGSLFEIFMPGFFTEKKWPVSLKFLEVENSLIILPSESDNLESLHLLFSRNNPWLFSGVEINLKNCEFLNILSHKRFRFLVKKAKFTATGPDAVKVSEIKESVKKQI